MANQTRRRAEGASHGQLALMSSSARPDEKEQDQPEKPGVLRPPAVERRGKEKEIDYTQHAVGRLLGNRGPAARDRLRAAVRGQLVAERESGADTVVDVILLENQVLWDWDRFTISRELDLKMRFQDFRGGDPVAFLCAQGLHERQLSQSRKALIVVSMCEWCARGRPNKPTATVDFSADTGRLHTIDEMADLGGVGTTLISQAKVVWSLGLAEDVADGKVGFAEAYRRARVVRDSEWEGAVLNGEMPFDDAYDRALSNAPEVPVVRPRQSRSVKSLIEEVRELERSKAELKEELQSLRGDNEVQRSAAAATAIALEREQIRADKAEAEVVRLRSELTSARLHA